jgi:hypothetical protein
MKGIYLSAVVSLLVASAALAFAAPAGARGGFGGGGFHGGQFGGGFHGGQFGGGFHSGGFPGRGLQAERFQGCGRPGSAFTGGRLYGGWAHRNHNCDYDGWRQQSWGYNYGYPGFSSTYYNQGLLPYYNGYPYNASVFVYPVGQTPETSTYDWPYATGLYSYSLAY